MFTVGEYWLWYGGGVAENIQTGSYLHPVMDLENFFLSTWNKSATSVCEAVNFVHILFQR